MKGFDAGPETSRSRFSSEKWQRQNRKKYNQVGEKKVWIIHFGSAEEGRISYDFMWIYGVLEVALKTSYS